MKSAVALGCSHTAGTGLPNEHCYVSVLSQHYHMPIANLGVPGGNCHIVEKRLVEYLDNCVPDFVIAQWPNVFRMTVWNHGQATNETVSNGGALFRLTMKHGEENFYQPWIQTIITCNLLCKFAGVPVVNIMIEDVDQQYHTMLNQHGIVLHTDQKLPGLTWLMDHGALDKMHHSAYCHAQWAERLIGLIDALDNANKKSKDTITQLQVLT